MKYLITLLGLAIPGIILLFLGNYFYYNVPIENPAWLFVIMPSLAWSGAVLYSYTAFFIDWYDKYL